MVKRKRTLLRLNEKMKAMRPLSPHSARVLIGNEYSWGYNHRIWRDGTDILVKLIISEWSFQRNRGAAEPRDVHHVQRPSSQRARVFLWGVEGGTCSRIYDISSCKCCCVVKSCPEDSMSLPVETSRMWRGMEIKLLNARRCVTCHYCQTLGARILSITKFAGV